MSYFARICIISLSKTILDLELTNHKLPFIKFRLIQFLFQKGFKARFKHFCAYYQVILNSGEQFSFYSLTDLLLNAVNNV